MSRLEKCVCITYVCLTIVLGGVLAYFKIILSDANNPITQKYNTYLYSKSDNNSNKSQGEVENTTISYKKHGQVVNIDSKLCIREEPNLDGNIIYYLYKGMLFDILEKNNGWYKIKYKDETGYVKEDYIQEYDESPPNQTYDEIQNNSVIANGMKESTPIKAELTAYCNCAICSETWGSQTAMQTHTRVGVIAAPKDIPLGSEVYIPELKDYKEDGIFSVEDRGGAVVVKSDGTYIIDVWLPTHKEVINFGRKKVTAYLVR